MAERQVGNGAVLGVPEVGALGAVLGRPREDVVTDHDALRLAHRTGLRRAGGGRVRGRSWCQCESGAFQPLNWSYHVDDCDCEH